MGMGMGMVNYRGLITNSQIHNASISNRRGIKVHSLVSSESFILIMKIMIWLGSGHEAIRKKIKSL